MTKDEAIAYKRRYQAVNKLEIEQLRSTSVEAKLEQAAALMIFAGQVGWGERIAEEESRIRERWLRLKRAYRRV